LLRLLRRHLWSHPGLASRLWSALLLLLFLTLIWLLRHCRGLESIHGYLALALVAREQDGDLVGALDVEQVRVVLLQKEVEHIVVLEKDLALRRQLVFGISDVLLAPAVDDNHDRGIRCVGGCASGRVCLVKTDADAVLFSDALVLFEDGRVLVALAANSREDNVGHVTREARQDHGVSRVVRVLAHGLDKVHNLAQVSVTAARPLDDDRGARAALTRGLGPAAKDDWWHLGFGKLGHLGANGRKRSKDKAARVVKLGGLLARKHIGRYEHVLQVPQSLVDRFVAARQRVLDSEVARLEHVPVLAQRHVQRVLRIREAEGLLDGCQCLGACLEKLAVRCRQLDGELQSGRGLVGPECLYFSFIYFSFSFTK